MDCTTGEGCHLRVALNRTPGPKPGHTGRNIMSAKTTSKKIRTGLYTIHSIDPKQPHREQRWRVQRQQDGMWHMWDESVSTEFPQEIRPTLRDCKMDVEFWGGGI